MNKDIPGRVGQVERTPLAPLAKRKTRLSQAIKLPKRELFLEAADITTLSHVVQYSLERSLGLNKKREKIA